MTQNDKAWKTLFDKYDILKHIEHTGEYIIQAKDIKECREPRLMTKIDHQLNLPQIFQENDLSILPITRGSYVISSFETFQKFEALNQKIERVKIPDHLQSLMPENIINEAMALDCAYSCGILGDFLEEEDLFPTVSGRMSSGEFNFSIKTKKGKRIVNVVNSQIEIDAAYEGVKYLSLFEAKSDIYDDFLIRQLYYPFRSWQNRVTKEIKSVFLIYTNGTFNLYQYKFCDPNDYNSLQLLKQSNYQISTSIVLNDIQNILRATKTIEEPHIPFPQANSMARIINLLESLSSKHTMAKDDITNHYAFDKRQTNYYTDAARYLGLVEKEKNKDITFKLSQLGRRIMTLPYRERQIELVKQIVKHHVFKQILELTFKSGQIPSSEKIVQVMKENNLYHVGSEKTFHRRSSTIIGWTNWILSLIED